MMVGIEQVPYGISSKELSSKSVLRPRRLSVSLLPLAVCIFLCSSCSALNNFAVYDKPQDISVFSDKVVLLELPFESQKTPNLCGLAAVEMLTRYYGILLNNEQRKTMAAEAEQNKGISGGTLKAVLEKSGYFVAVFPGTIDREPTGIYRHLDERRPLLVMLKSKDGQSNHYALLIGYDPERSLLALLDPGKGRFAVPLENFEKDWVAANNFMLLAIPSETSSAKAGNDTP